MTPHFDLFIIGSGPAASGIATRCRKAGWSVGLTDHRPYGGTCPLRGCDPKKVLVGAAGAVDLAGRLAAKGALGGAPAIDWPGLMAFKRTFTEPIPAGHEKMFQGLGIETMHGRARFTGRNALRVGESEIRADHIAIACGAEPAPLPIEGAEHLTTSDEFLELESLPHRIAIVGGGYIGFEFAHIAARAGAIVTLLEMKPMPLEGFDPDLVGRLMGRTEELGVSIRTGHTVMSIQKSGGGLTVMASGPDGDVEILCDAAVHGGGRVPAVAELDLEAGGVAHEGRHLQLNDYLQSTSNQAVYAAGDATGRLPLTPVAGMHAGVVAGNLLEGNRRTADESAFPSVVFSVPPLARVGLLEAEARERGILYDVATGDGAGWYTARRENESCYAWKTLVDRNSGKILGAHLLGPHADEVINLFAMAIRFGIGARELKSLGVSYPTTSSDLSSMLP